MLAAIRKLEALLLLAAIALTPVVIVFLEPRRGGIWVAGYVAGVIITPFIAIGALRAILELTGDLDGVIGFVAYGSLTILISVATALWALLG
jgi:hypothetical protein